jgi:radical SAM protein with 4Fe4S-binding SPASM domain
MLSSLRTLAHRAYQKIETSQHELSYLFLEITRACNLSCRHCGSDCRHEPEAAELTKEQWFDIVDYLDVNFKPAPFLVITGGEPLCSPILWDVLARIRQKNMHWGMVTNGLALTAPVLRRLEAAGLHSITLSIDGLEREHNWLRGNAASFRQAVNALELLATSSVPFKDAVTCVHPANLGQLGEIAELLLAKGMPAWRLFRIFASGRARQHPELSMTPPQTRQMLDWLQLNRPRYASRGLQVNLSCEGWLPMQMDRQLRSFPFFCRAGINIASILCDGTVTGCSNNHLSLSQGHFFKDDFKTLWQQGFGPFRHRTWLKKTACGKCRHLKACNGSSMHLWERGQESIGYCYLDAGSR